MARLPSSVTGPAARITSDCQDQGNLTEIGHFQYIIVSQVTRGSPNLPLMIPVAPTVIVDAKQDPGSPDPTSRTLPWLHCTATASSVMMMDGNRNSRDGDCLGEGETEGGKKKGQAMHQEEEADGPMGLGTWQQCEGA